MYSPFSNIKTFFGAYFFTVMYLQSIVFEFVKTIDREDRGNQRRLYGQAQNGRDGKRQTHPLKNKEQIWRYG